MLMAWGTWRFSVIITQVSLYLKRTCRPPKFLDMLLRWAISTTCWVTSKYRALRSASFTFRGQQLFQRGTREQGLRFGTGTSRNSGRLSWESLHTTSAVLVYSAKVKASCLWKLLHGQFQKWGLHTSPQKPAMGAPQKRPQVVGKLHVGGAP